MNYQAIETQAPDKLWHYLWWALLPFILFSGTAQAANCSATYTHTHTGTGGSNYTLNAGQSLKIASGTYTGALDGFASGSSVCVEMGATFAPSNINVVTGTLTNYGTTSLQTFVYDTGAVIDNYGTLSFPGGLNTNGATTFHNRSGATMNMDYSFQLGHNSTFTNDGLLVAKQDFNTENGTTLTNNHRLEMEGNFNPDGKFDNYGRVYAKAFMNININSDVSNYCTLVSWGGFNNNSPLMDNQGTILITTAGGTPGGLWQNNQPFKNGSAAKIAGGDFFNNSTFTGGGFMIFAGDTRNQGAFNGNSAADKITFYDETQTGAQIFDAVGVAPTNTVRTAFARPTELDAPSNCSTSYKNFALAGTAGTVSGTVYTDSNLNNTLDATETKLPNITVWLYDSTGVTLLQTKTTDASGAYAFTGVTAGTYQVKADAADADRPAGATIGTINPLTGVTVTAGATTANQNFGFDPAPGTVSGTVYTDSNLNNTLDATETKLPNITVWLYDSTGVTLLQTKTTDASGAYAFTGVTAGTYQVKADAADADRPAGATIGTTNPLTGVAVTAGNTTANQNFGFDQAFPSAICGQTIDNPLELDFSGTATLVSGTAKQVGSTYRFSNVASNVDALVTMNALQVDTLPRWLDGDLGGQMQGSQADKFFDMTVKLVNTGTSTLIGPVDLVLNSFDVDGSAGEPYSDGIEYFSAATTFTGTGSKLQASDMGGSVRYTLPLSARGIDDPTAVDPAYAAGAVYTNVSSFRTKGLVVEDNGSSTRSVFIYADGASFKKFGALDCGTEIPVSTVSGTIFEDVNYGGGAGSAFGAAGTAGVSGARVELYDASGKFLTSTTTTTGGSYSFATLPDGSYYVRVVNDTVSSSRTGSTGAELAVQTYRRNDAAAVTNEVGGRKPAAADAGANTSNQSLDTSTFLLSGGGQAQSVQPVSVGGGSVPGVSFGFNFDTIVNANDSGQGSLRQFLLNAGLLGGDSALAQTNGYTAGKENAILRLPTTDPGYAAGAWTINLKSPLPNINDPVVLDGSKQQGFTNQPVLVLNGSGAGAGDGLTLHDGSDGSAIHALAIKNFQGAGIRLTYTAGNMIGGSNSGQGNVITANSGDGIVVDATAEANNSILGNSIHSNGALGIDLNDDGVTANDAGDTDSGPNNLLNYPDVQAASFGANGSKIVTYDFYLDLPVNANGYRLEFFKNAAKDSSGNGEGQIFLGSKDFSHPGTGVLQFKGTFNANQAVASSEFIAITVTEKTGATTFGSTSEFSGAANNNTVLVCTSLIDNPSAALPDMTIDENADTITYLKAKDSSGNPITYVISGGVDGGMFSVGPVTNGTIDCAQVQFVKSVIVKETPAEPRVIVPGIPDPGNFEVPMDAGKDNIYDIEITATDSAGKKYVRTLSMRVMDVNEAPIITSSATTSLEEDGATQVLDIKAQDQDGETEGNGLSYSLSGGVDQGKFSLDASTGVLSFKAVPDYDAPTDSNRDNVYAVAVTVTDAGGLTASKTFSITVLNRVTDDGVKLQARAFLQGAYDSNTGLMSADLNTLGLLPGSQPYQTAPFNHAGTETLSPLVRESSGNNAVVDWMLIELRSSPTTLISSRAVMVQRNGNLVDAQTGSPTLHFASVKTGNYYVSIRHRNHLGVISASPVSLGSTEKLVDFTLSTTAVNGTETRYTSGTLALLWVGDINGSNTLSSSGPANDITSLLSSVLTSQDNPQAYTNYTLHGYFNTDLNMDGKTLFSGPGNDANALMGNVITHPLNSNFAANYIVRGGLQ